MARRTVEKFEKRVAQLYEQGADAVRIGQYVGRWIRWTTAGLDVSFRGQETGKPWCIANGHTRVPVVALTYLKSSSMLTFLPPTEKAEGG